MSSNDLRQLRGLIREALNQTGMTGRRLEEELEIGHGNLQHLLEGQLELRVRHLLTIARLLKIPPHQLLELGCPEATRTASYDLADVLGRKQLPQRAAKEAAGLSEDRVRSIFREELSRLMSGPAATKGEPGSEPAES
jgi:hypothetical protein